MKLEQKIISNNKNLYNLLALVLNEILIIPTQPNL